MYMANKELVKNAGILVGAGGVAILAATRFLGGTGVPEHNNESHSEEYIVASEVPDNVDTLSPSDVDSTNWDDYEIQKDGMDGQGIINFKTTTAQ